MTLPSDRETPQVAVWTQLGLSQEEFYALPPTDRLALQRQHQPPPVAARRPVERVPPQALRDEWAELSAERRATAYRTWREIGPPWKDLPEAEQIEKYHAWLATQPKG
jgi:hypothetical protein